MHELLTAPSSELTAQMVKDFVELGIAENLTVEYKRQGDKPIEAVAALANTYGGIVLVGVAEEPKTVPSEVVGVTRKEKESLVNQLATKFDPPWSPEVIEVPLDDASDKVVLVIRISRDTVPAPIVLDGSILVRLDARNVHASRAMMAAMLAQATDVRAAPRLGHAMRRPDTHRVPVSSGPDVQQPDLILRAVTSFPLRSNGRRSRVATGMPGRITAALQKTQLDPLVNVLSLRLQRGQSSVITPWQLAGSTSSNVVLERSARAGQEGHDNARLLCRVAAGIGNSGLEVCCDLVFWLDGMVLPWGFVQQSLMELVPAAANVLLPETVSAVVGNVTLPPPVVEIHLSTHRHGEQEQPIEGVIDVTTIGARDDARPFYSSGEVLDETLIDGDDWAPAILDAFTVMAMDWGYPSPVFLDQGLSRPLQ
ncbi:ATP-binding protein [Streptomyces sp. NPDC028722]|uniref:AlbA family DNA-binding domain-containing protein n=1 Tax=Streptomyces sp. NPDC028722 TaxID=3155016 RepID=UPI0033F771B0